MDPSTAALGGGSAIGVMLLYWVLKRLRTSTCVVDHCSGCLSINIPEEVNTIVKQSTDRLEKRIEELILAIHQPSDE